MTTRVLAFLFSAAGTLNFTAERDLQINFISTSVGTYVVTTDPDAVLADFTAPPSNAVRQDVFRMGTGSFEVGAIPVLKGQTVYVTMSAAGTVCLYLS